MLSEKEAEAVLVEATREADDETPDWSHWRTSPNFSCWMTADGEWMVQVHRSEPFLSIHKTGDAVEVDIIAEDRKKMIVGLAKMAVDPAESFVGLVKTRDEPFVSVHTYDMDELDAVNVVGMKMRQAAWSGRTEEPYTGGEMV